MPRSSAKPSAILQLKVTLAHIKPPVWRRLQVPSDITLARLHDLIQVAMGWETYHLHEFLVGDHIYGVPDPDDNGRPVKDHRKIRLSQVAREVGAELRYVYDFGDDWEHQIIVEKVLLPEPRKRYPVCIDGKRACPPEDCGGPWGYGDLLTAIRNPKHERHEELLEWLGSGFDPEDFSADRVNKDFGARR